jgi:copper chaperone CopZ
MTRYFILSALLTLMSTGPLRGEFRQIDLTIYGMDWAVCAHAVRVGMEKLAGVESVEVSLNRGLASLKLKAGNSVRLEQVHEVVTSKGFTPREARVAVMGEMKAGDGRPGFKVSGIEQLYEVEIDSKAAISPAELGKLAGRKLMAEGVIAAPPPPKANTRQIIHLSGFLER